MLGIPLSGHRERSLYLLAYRWPHRLTRFRLVSYEPRDEATRRKNKAGAAVIGEGEASAPATHPMRVEDSRAVRCSPSSERVPCLIGGYAKCVSPFLSGWGDLRQNQLGCSDLPRGFPCTSCAQERCHGLTEHPSRFPQMFLREWPASICPARLQRICVRTCDLLQESSHLPPCCLRNTYGDAVAISGHSIRALLISVE